jgi:Gamma-glutamyl cyclotransferase, AIG2-like
VTPRTPAGLAPFAAPDSERERLLPVFLAAGLIDTAFVEKLLEHVVATAAARLPGYRRVALAGVAWSVLVPAPGNTVEGMVLLALSHEDLRRLDAYGGVGEALYRRSAALVEIEGRSAAEPAFIYLPTERTLRRLAAV